MTASITCPRCGMTSHSVYDVREGYCGHCHDWTGAINGLRQRVAGLGERDIGNVPLYYDRQSAVISLARWAWLVEYGGPEYKVVARTEVDLYTVSTVWIGLNHEWEPTRPPLIFETMTFLSGTPMDTYMLRYHTEAEARAGHEAIVAEIRVAAEHAVEHVDREEHCNDNHHS